MRERAMVQLQQAAVRNRLLSGIPLEGFGLLQPHLEPIALDLRQWLIEAGEPIRPRPAPMVDRGGGTDPARHLSRTGYRLDPSRHLRGPDRGRFDWSRGHGGP